MNIIFLIYFISFFDVERNVEMVRQNSFVEVVRTDFSFGNRFISIITKGRDSAIAIKGLAYYNNDSLLIQSADTSKIFKLDSLALFIEKACELKKNPYIRNNSHDTIKAEVFLNDEKIYSSFRWRENFWNLFGLIYREIPSEYNPFPPYGTFLIDQ